MIIFLALSLTFSAKAQQDPHFSMFWNNYSIINPAASGLYYKHQASAQWRHQSKTTGSEAITGGYNTKLDFIHGGLGVAYLYEKFGSPTYQRANLDYSYQIKLNETNVLSAGIGLGVIYRDYSDWPVSFRPKNETAFAMNLGVVYKNEKLSVGLSSTQVNMKERDFIIFADYVLNITPDIDLKPRILARADVKMYGEFSLMGSFKKQYWLGAGYRSLNTVYFMAGWDIREKFRIGYSYSLTTSKSKLIPRDTHEVVLAFLLK